MADEIIACHRLVLGRTATYVDDNHDADEGHSKRKLAVPLDLTFLVGSQKVPVQCHRHTISLHSDVLNTMLNGSMAESNESEVILSFEGLSCEDEGDASTFRKFIRAIYTGNLELNDESVTRMVGLLSYLMAPQLLPPCYEYMVKRMNNETFFSFLEVAARWKEPRSSEYVKFKKVVDTYLSINFCELIKSEKIYVLSKNTLIENLLKRDRIPFPEVLLFKAVVNWGKYQDDSVTQSVLCYIRFPVIPPEDLTKIVAPANLVGNADLIEAFMFQSILDQPNEVERMTKGDDTGKFKNRYGEIARGKKWTLVMSGMSSKPANTYGALVDVSTPCSGAGTTFENWFYHGRV